jgi:nitric oxide dioxygenase
MAIDPRQIELIRESFEWLARNPERRSLEFYKAFFARAPELKPMFREDLEGQGMRFLSTLSAIVAHLDRPDEMAERLTDLGQSHRAMGVKAADFDPMGRALLDTLEGTMGDSFTPDMRVAWEAGFAAISATLVEKGQIPKA